MNRVPLAERRALLVEAALRVAAESGVEAVTVRAVAYEAGVSLGTVHYCFHDKAELLDAMGRSISLTASDEVKAAIEAAADQDVATIVRGCAPALLDGLRRHRQVRRLLLEIATIGARNPTLRATAQTHLRESTEMTAGVVRRIADLTGVRFTVEIDVVARLSTALIDGIELAWLVDEDDERAIEGFYALADLVVSYVDAVPRTASA